MSVLPSSESHLKGAQISVDPIKLDGEFAQRFFLRLKGTPAISVIENSMIPSAVLTSGEPDYCSKIPINSFLLMLKRVLLPSDILICEKVVQGWKKVGVTNVHLYFYERHTEVA